MTCSSFNHSLHVMDPFFLGPFPVLNGSPKRYNVPSRRQGATTRVALIQFSLQGSDCCKVPNL